MKDCIKDNQGNLLEVTDLQAAILQSAQLLALSHTDPSPAQMEQDLARQRYWKDVYIKLCQLRALRASRALRA